MITFRRTLRQGDRGPDALAVKRALARAGFGSKKLLAITRLFGPFAVKNLKRFQQAHRLHVDGIYGPLTHAALAPFFDSYAWARYAEHHPAGTYQLPAAFTPTHTTSGLPGFPAIDVFQPAGTIMLAPATGTVTRVSGKAPTRTVKPGGAYGWSVYLAPDRAPDKPFFLTHFGTLSVQVGDHLEYGHPVGAVADFAAATNGVTPDHIHEGRAA